MTLQKMRAEREKLKTSIAIDELLLEDLEKKINSLTTGENSKQVNNERFTKRNSVAQQIVRMADAGNEEAQMLIANQLIL